MNRSLLRCPILAITLVGMMVGMMAATTRGVEKDDEGFVPLFNGKDLSGWQTTGTWEVEDDGVLALKPKPGERGIFSYRLFLWTKRSFSNFVLDLEFKLEKGGDSSVFLRSQTLGGYIEVEVSDSYGKEGPLTPSDCGGVQKVMPPSKNMCKPPGQWNQMRITCDGNLLKVHLNGEQVIDLDYETQKRLPPRSGPIGLQDWGTPVWYRNIRIKKL